MMKCCILALFVICLAVDCVVGFDKPRQNRLANGFHDAEPNNEELPVYEDDDGDYYYDGVSMRKKERNELLQKLLTTPTPLLEDDSINLDNFHFKSPVTVDEDLDGKNSITDHMYDIYSDDENLERDGDDVYYDDEYYDDDDDDLLEDDDVYYDEEYEDDGDVWEREQPDESSYENVPHSSANGIKTMTKNVSTDVEPTVPDEKDEKVNHTDVYAKYMMKPLYVGIMIGSAASTFFIVLSVFCMCRIIRRDNRNKKDLKSLPDDYFYDNRYSPIVKNSKHAPLNAKDFLVGLNSKPLLTPFHNPEQQHSSSIVNTLQKRLLE